MKLSKAHILAIYALLAALGLPNARAGQDAQEQNRLVNGKLIYIAPMPQQLDQWLQSDLQHWGKYHVTSNSEGVDLEIRAEVPDTQPQYRERHGVPLPKKEPKDKPKETSIEVIDWTTGARLWTATLLDKKVDHNAPAPPPGPSIEIRAHGMTPDQLALKITRELQRYVEQLQAASSD